MKIRVIWPGKTKHAHFREAIENYSARIRRFVPFDVIETKEYSAEDRYGKQRISRESKILSAAVKDSICVILDIAGKEMSSEEFAGWMGKQNRDIDFLIGGPVGLNIQNPDLKLSLGRWTFPHDLVRVILLEQIYRAFTILRQVPYHK